MILCVKSSSRGKVNCYSFLYWTEDSYLSVGSEWNRLENEMSQ